ncbi:MAG TPA: hypothetical protein VK797_00175 [Tepidisphaeraceae bacterium]|jgi:hypothetical protein|nr:hypothetical protein [Tepidisphaeraceae bacterium]
MNGINQGFQDNGDSLWIGTAFDLDPFEVRPRPQEIACADPEWSVCFGPDESACDSARARDQ